MMVYRHGQGRVYKHANSIYTGQLAMATMKYVWLLLFATWVHPAYYPSPTGFCVCSTCESVTFGVKTWPEYVDESLGCSNFHRRIKLQNERGNTVSIRRAYADNTWSISDRYGDCTWSICGLNARNPTDRRHLWSSVHDSARMFDIRYVIYTVCICKPCETELL